MRKIFSGVFLAIFLFTTTWSTTYAAEIHMKVDGIPIVSDAKPETKNNRTMVPLRALSENLGAKVEWSDSKVILTKNDMKIVLTINSSIAEKNGEKIQLDVKPYMKDNRIFVPLRFIAETFGCNVNYSNSTVTVETKPLIIDGVKVKALQYEIHMTMGGIIQQIDGNTYNETIYNLFEQNKGTKVDAPTNYSWMYTIDTLGSYAKRGQYDYLNLKGDSIKRYDIYDLVNTFPTELLEGYPRILLHDVTKDEWYLFNDTAAQSIYNLTETAGKNGFLTLISNTVA